MSDEKEVVKTEVDVAKQEVDVAKQEVDVAKQEIDVAKQEIDVAAVVEKIEKRLNDVEAKVRKVITWKDKMQAWQDKMQAWKDGASANWKKFCQTHLGSIADDGKLSGYARSWFASFVFVICLSIAAIAATTIVDNKPGPEGANFAFKDVTGVGTLEVKGGEGDDAVLILDADEGDNDEDTWTIESESADNDLSFVNHTTERMKLSAAGLLTASGGVKFPVASDVNVTNDQVVTLAYGINVLVPIGGTNTQIHTITFANGAKGQQSVVICKTGSTNKIAVAQSGNFYGPALALTAGDMATLWAADTNAWYGIGQ